MELTIISDTHMRHDELGTLSGDVLIHCGDMFDLFETNGGDVERVDAWFSRQRFELILCVGGNHDRRLEQRPDPTVQPFENAVYLEDQTWEHDGVTFYGTPWVPFLQSHAYFADEHRLQEKWSRIPENVDVLITHTPPAGILDRSSRGRRLGCGHLARRVASLAPPVHCFGHVHASGGTTDHAGTIYVNASSVVGAQAPLRAPYLVSL